MDDHLHDVEFNEETRLVHFKFEAMVSPRFQIEAPSLMRSQLLHLQTETLELANNILKCTLSAGFRESRRVS
jgi:tRNA(Phe) wybutosine-synthesizing methylase Tyw3